MKKVFSLLLAVLMLVSALPVAYAADTNDHSQGTQVVFEAANSESYTITVPASLKPGQGGTVTLAGEWPDNKTISVTADKTVTLTNSIKAADTKTLNVTFLGISEAGSNTSKQTFTEPVSVEGISNALFGTWSGKFNYNVETTTAEGTPVLEGDGQVFFTALPETLSFRSTAPIGEFQEVQINGATVDPSNYTVTEGSTIITLHEDYLMTLGAEAHQITVVSDSGSPSAGFSVRDTITYEEGDYIYTIMQDGFATLEIAQAYYRIYLENQTGMSWDDFLSMNDYDEDEYWAILTDTMGIGLTEDTFLVDNNPTRYWSVAPQDRTKDVYGHINNEILNYPVTDMESAFYDCTSLTIAPNIPDSITNMTGTFYGCTNLTSIVIPKSVTDLSYGAFSQCINLTQITFEGTIAQWNAITFDVPGDEDAAWNQECGEITVTCTDGTVIVPAYGT